MENRIFLPYVRICSAVSICPAAEHQTRSQIDLISPANRNFHRISTKREYKTLMGVFDVCLQISKKYFGFEVDEFSKREHTINSQVVVSRDCLTRSKID